MGNGDLGLGIGGWGGDWRSAVAEDGRALNVLAGRKDGDAAELAIPDPLVAVLQRLDALAELLAHDLELREDEERMQCGNVRI